jgi:predicted transcriptional regulator of viral defense system
MSLVLKSWEVARTRYYVELLRLRCFTRSDVAAMTGSGKAADSLLTSYRRRGLIDQVRRGLWVALGLDDGQPAASRYRIATEVGPGACVSHHSAFEYHGLANQVFYEVYVSSPRRFTPFDYDGVTYRFVAERLDAGVVDRRDGVRVTDVERTVLDAINDVDRIGGLEEFLACLDLVPVLDTSKLLAYLAGYGKQVLYQKTGFLLGHYAERLRLPESFFADCEAHLGAGVRYLGNPKEGRYDRRWRLVVPARRREATAL